MFVNGYKWIASGVFPGFGERDRFTCMLTKSADDLKWMGGDESDNAQGQGYHAEA